MSDSILIAEIVELRKTVARLEAELATLRDNTDWATNIKESLSAPLKRWALEAKAARRERLAYTASGTLSASLEEQKGQPQ